MRRAILIASLLAASLVGGGFASLSGSQQVVSSTLHGVVGPSFQISLPFDDGTPVTNLLVGTYDVEVKGLSPQHNFHVYGPGVDRRTEIPETLTSTRYVGRKTVGVELRPGKWKIYSSAREPALSAFFDVT